MVHVSTAAAAWMSLVAVVVVGFFGLRMCRLTLRSTTVSDLRREAATSMLRPGNSYCLTTRQREAVFAALYGCAEVQEGSTHQARFHGSKGAMREEGPALAGGTSRIA